jgi:hypothetical protein
MAKKPRKIETPGASAAPSPESQPAAESQAAPAAITEGAAALPTTGTASQTVAAEAAKAESLNRQVEHVRDNLVGSPAALDWGHLTNPARLMSVVGVNAPDKDPNAHLPHPDAVDWSKTKDDRILTKHGWLLRP